MAYNDITEAGALVFIQVQSTFLNAKTGCCVITTTSGEKLIADRRSGIQAGNWLAVLIRKSNALAIPGIVDLAPYYIDWCHNLDHQQVKGLANVMLRLYEGTQSLAQWRQQLTQAEHEALLSSAFAAISGVSTVAGGVAFIGDLLSGGLPVASGLWTAASGLAFGANLGHLEAAAKRGDLCVQQINRTSLDLIQLGRQIDLPFCTPHHTPVIQSACTGLAQAFGWKNKTIEATQAGLLSWIQTEPRFAS